MSEHFTADPDDARVLVFRHPSTGRAVAVPAEIVEKADLDYQAYVMRQTGADWATIARALGFDSAAAAASRVSTYLRDAAATVNAADRAEALRLTIDRLEYYLSRLSPEIVKGNIAAINAAHSLVVSEARLLRLDEVEAGAAEGRRTVVISAQDYKADLQRAITNA